MAKTPPATTITAAAAAADSQRPAPKTSSQAVAQTAVINASIAIRRRPSTSRVSGSCAAYPEAEVRADALERVAGMPALRRRDCGQQRVIARPEDAVGEPDECHEGERVPGGAHERKEGEPDREQRQRGGERSLRSEPVGSGAARRAGDARHARAGR